ncbi:PREDICTED: uncharacterized protein LOC109178491 [Ipomoea nil]|uniref:uncharacterized protein LOC109178491 n=1 Tax=Ipomoea nil TaxID=35883 RepID=UPI000900BCB1|nr:PREDICTED: uncharacterized protein LOC109178491 [Ipomoea nil]
MWFITREHEFLKEIGIGPTNLSCYVNGAWKASGPTVSTVNPANNEPKLLKLQLKIMKKACRLVTKQQSCGCRFQHQKEVILLGRLVMHLEQNFTTLADLFT